MPLKKIRKIKENLAPKGSIKANFLTLMTGTVISQLIVVAVSPILTRLFSPSVFGIYGVYISIVSIAAAIVTLRYDQALMLPKDNNEAASLFWASLFSSIGISSLFLVICFVFYKQIITLLKVNELNGWILLLPLSVFLAGFYQTLNSWSTRQKKFKRASASQVVKSATTSSGQILFGVLKLGPIGLIGASVLGDLFSAFTIAFHVKRNEGKILKNNLRFNSIKQLSKHYSDFPVYSGTQNLLNVISQNLPLIFLARFFGSAVVGFYALSVRVLQLPMDLVLTSLNQVLFQKISEVYNSGEETYILFKKSTVGLFVLAIIPTMIMFLFGPTIFGFVLGKEWVVAGEYARWLVLWLAVAFINPPAILFARIYRKQGFLLFQDIFLLLFRLAVIILGGIYLSSLKTIILYSMVGIIFNAFIILYMWCFILRHQQNRLKNSRSNIP